jgi:hypothetical protein
MIDINSWNPSVRLPTTSNDKLIFANALTSIASSIPHPISTEMWSGWPRTPTLRYYITMDGACLSLALRLVL